jgi:hypothetical protein
MQILDIDDIRDWQKVTCSVNCERKDRQQFDLTVKKARVLLVPLPVCRRRIVESSTRLLFILDQKCRIEVGKKSNSRLGYRLLTQNKEAGKL